MNDARTTFGSRKVIRLAAVEKAIVGNACARAVADVWALEDGCVAPSLATNAQAENRALRIKNRFVRWFRSVPDGPLSRLPSLARSCRPRIRLRTLNFG